MNIGERGFFGIDYIGEVDELNKLPELIMSFDIDIESIIEDNKKEALKTEEYILWDNSVL